MITGLELTAGPQSQSSQIWDLTAEIQFWTCMLTVHLSANQYQIYSVMCQYVHENWKQNLGPKQSPSKLAKAGQKHIYLISGHRIMKKKKKRY